MSTQGLALTGNWKLQVIGPDGQVKQEVVKKNLIVNAGLNFLREYLLDSVTPTTAARMGWIAIGTDATAVSAANTTLGTEVAREAVETYTAGGTGVASIDNTFAAGVGTGTITEAGVFNASAAGTMLNRVVFSSVTKGAGDALKVTFTLTLANA